LYSCNTKNPIGIPANFLGCTATIVVKFSSPVTIDGVAFAQTTVGFQAVEASAQLSNGDESESSDWSSVDNFMFGALYQQMPIFEPVVGVKEATVTFGTGVGTGVGAGVLEIVVSDE
jgi:hypothetical protein